MAAALPVPQVGINTPMSGEPAGAALDEARLVATSCNDVATEDATALANDIKEMRAAVDASYKEWVDAQPDCWAQMRADWRMMHPDPGRGSLWGDGIGDSFGAGGLGLTGVGEGGGGRGEGIGLGGIGIGHGRLAGSASSAKIFSATNNQVAGVDEADIVKTDGRFVYLVSNGALRIVEAMNPRVLSVTPIRGTTRDLFVLGDRTVVYSSDGGKPVPDCTYGYDCVFRGDGTSTKITVLDISNRSAPHATRSMELSGSLVAARRIGNTVHTIVADNDNGNFSPSWETWPDGLGMCGTDWRVVVAKVAKLKADNERAIRTERKPSAQPTLTENGKSRSMCQSVLRTSMPDGKAFTSVVSFDMTKDSAPPTTVSVRSRPGAVFASDKGIYFSVVHTKGAGGWYSHYPSVDEVSEIHKFKIGESPSDTRYVGSGTVPGHVLNQFAMDEWYGYLRVATSRGRVPDPKVESAISVLAETDRGALTRIGAVTGIAPGEDIRAVRFDNERGYVVTFKKTDPLFVIDTLDPSKPKVMGELKIPGFSTYLHRIDAEHLLSIGFDANDHGDFAYFDGVILQLFDVKDPTSPKLLHKEKIGTRGSSSEAATNHLAFNYLPQAGLLALPMTICQGGGDGTYGGNLEFSGLLVYRVDVNEGFTRLGGIDHGSKGVSCNTWWSQATSQVKRSVFLDDLVYSIADDRVKVQKMGHFGTDVADLAMTDAR